MYKGKTPLALASFATLAIALLPTTSASASSDQICLNCDTRPTLSVADDTQIEDTNTFLHFVVRRRGDSLGIATVQFQTADNTAIGGTRCFSPQGVPLADYQLRSGTLTFGPGEVTKSISVLVCHDRVNEGDDETLFLNLSSPTGARIVDGQAVGTIIGSEALEP